MRPRRTILSNAVFVLEGGNEDNDLWIRKSKDGGGNQLLCSVWEPTPEERLRIAGGANVELVIWGSSHPPVAMDIDETPLGKAPAND